MSSFTDRTFDGLDSISNTAVSYKKQELLTLHGHLCSTPDVLVKSVLLNFLVFYVGLYSLSLFGVLFPMLPVSLDCLFLLFPMLPVFPDCLFLLFPMLPVSLDCLFLLIPMLPVSLDCLFLLFPMLPVSLDCLFL